MAPRKQSVEDGPTKEQLELMRAIEALKNLYGKPPTQALIGERLGKNRSAVGMMLRTLTDLGWYEPVPAERDLTPAGREMLRKRKAGRR